MARRNMTSADLARLAAGKRPVHHANRGSALEAIIVGAQRDVIRVHRFGQAAKRVKGGRVVGIQGPVDFGGTVCKTGRSIWFDAKTSEVETSFPIGNRDHFPQHQRQFLYTQGEAGAIAGLVVWCKAHAMYLWIGWEDVRAMELTPTVPWADPRLKLLGNSELTVDFLNVPGLYAGQDVELRPAPETTGSVLHKIRASHAAKRDARDRDHF